MDELYGSLKTGIDAILSDDRTVCLWYSGGNDSRLLLETMLKAGKPFGLLRFEDGWTKEQKRQTDAIILQYKLQAYSYPALQHTLVGEDGELSLVSCYAIDAFGRSAVIVRDLVDAPERCGLDENLLAKPRMLAAPADFDIHIWGTRWDDRHWIRGDKPMAPAREWKIGEKQFIAPLYDWTARQVRETLKTEFAVELNGINTGDLRCCSNCLRSAKAYCPKLGKEIAGIDWDKTGNLELVRSLI